VADGPRASHQSDSALVKETRAVVESFSWTCEVLTNYSDNNLGCKRRVSSGLDWIFDQVPEAIILEDDCLPDPTFFYFARDLLERYRNDRRVGSIGASNFVTPSVRGKASYYFSQYTHVWGWASWSDRWKSSYDVEMRMWPIIRDGGWLEDIFHERDEANYWRNTLEAVYCGKIDTWDYQWAFANFINNRVSIIPATNLVKNIGFGIDATHTVDPSHTTNDAVALDFPLIHPQFLVRNARFDLKTFNVWMRPTASQRMKWKIRQILRL